MNYSIFFYDYPENSPLAEFHNQAIGIFPKKREYLMGGDGYISPADFVTKINWKIQSSLFNIDKKNYYVRIKDSSGKIILSERITSSIRQSNLNIEFDTIRES